MKKTRCSELPVHMALDSNGLSKVFELSGYYNRMGVNLLTRNLKLTTELYPGSQRLDDESYMPNEVTELLTMHEYGTPEFFDHEFFQVRHFQCQITNTLQINFGRLLSILRPINYFPTRRKGG